MYPDGPPPPYSPLYMQGWFVVTGVATAHFDALAAISVDDASAFLPLLLRSAIFTDVCLVRNDRHVSLNTLQARSLNNEILQHSLPSSACLCVCVFLCLCEYVSMCLCVYLNMPYAKQ